MQTKKVVVVPYDEKWKAAFEEIKNEIEAALGDIAFGVEHIGSTSVKGMSAKPCIAISLSGIFSGKAPKLLKNTAL